MLPAAAALAGVTLALGTTVPAGASAPGATSRRPARPAIARRVGIAPQISRSAVRVGALAPSTRLRVDVVLYPRDPAALAAFAAAVSTPGSASYGHYLARGQFARRFGPTASAIAVVRRSLAAVGLGRGRLAPNHLSIQYLAPAARLGRAFATGFERYRLPTGRVAFANTSAPRIAGAAAPAVQGVIGLDDLTREVPLGLERLTTHRRLRVGPRVVTGGPQPCAAAVAAGPANDAFTADQLAAAYRFSTLYGAGDEGAGASVALFELEPDKASDIAAYQSCYGTSATVTYLAEDGGAGSGAGSGEAALDIEDVIGLAPKAAITVYQAPNSNTGLYDDYSAIVSNDASKVVSTSWGECEAKSSPTVVAEENTLFEQAATQGQSVFAAAGDGGSEDCGTTKLGVDDPASQPYVTGVGGTEITALGTPPTEVVWNERANGSGAGGGGISTLHAMPSYQSAAPSGLDVVNAHSSSTPCGAPSGTYCREVPDVSADADPYSGYLVYYEGAWTGIGGTSAAAPLWAALMALTDASSACDGVPIGFANPALYAAAASSYAADFDDITSGNNDYTGTNGGLYPAGAGYDMASGLGTPNAAGLPSTLCAGVAAAPAKTTTSLVASPTAPVVGEPVTYTATVAPVAPATSVPTGTVVIDVGSVAVCTATLDASSPDEGSCSAPEAAAGTVDVTASYGGDAKDDASASSPALALTVAKATTTTTLVASPTAPVVGEPVTYTATVASVAPGAGTPTGDVTVGGASGTVCSAALDRASPDVASCATTYTGAGAVSSTASFAGDGNFTASTSTALGVTVYPAATATALVAAPSPSVVGEPVTYTATVTATAPGAGNPTGTVTFTGDAGALCSGTLGATTPASASCTTTYTAAAGDAVTASYGGGANFAPSTSSPLDQSVTPDETATSLASTVADPVVGQAVTFSATVAALAPGAGSPTGTVTFTGAAGVLCGSVPLSSTAPDQASCTTTYDAPGTDAVTATYSGDGNDLASTSAVTGETIGPDPTATAISADSPSVVVGQTVTYQATVSPEAPGSGVATGTVTFVGTAGTLCTSTLDASGQASCTASYASSGGDAVTAVYGGAAGYSGSISSTVDETIGPAATATTLSATTATAVAGEPVTFTATVTAAAPGSGTPTGSVVFKTTATLCTVALSATDPDRAACTVAFTTLGKRTMTATYLASPDDTGSTSTGVAETVAQAATTTEVAAPTSSTVTGQSVTLTATVTGAAPSTGRPGGTLVFSVEEAGGAALTCNNGDSKALSAGVAHCVLPGADLSPAVSPLAISARFAGTVAYSASQATAGHDVDKAGTKVTVTSSLNPAAAGRAVTFTATVRAIAPGTGTPSGTVTIAFDPAGSLSCSGTDSLELSTSGKAVCPLPSGTLERSVTVSATYSGSAAFEESSGSLAETVG